MQDAEACFLVASRNYKDKSAAVSSRFVIYNQTLYNIHNNYFLKETFDRKNKVMKK